ncbi:hypothetical protein HID58_081898, partial [Brassica napus]
KKKKTGSKTPSISTNEANASVGERHLFIFLHLFAAAYMPRKGKVPKRINKAVRERIICEHLNELFIELADSLELNQQNSGRVSVLCEATQFLKDVFGQI